MAQRLLRFYIYAARNPETANHLVLGVALPGTDVRRIIIVGEIHEPVAPGLTNPLWLIVTEQSAISGKGSLLAMIESLQDRLKNTSFYVAPQSPGASVER